MLRISFIFFPFLFFSPGIYTFPDVFVKHFEFSLKKEKHNVAYFRGLAVDKRGNYFVIDFANKQIFKFDKDGNLIKIIGNPGNGPGEFQAPLAIAIDGAENIYVADNELRRINVFDNEGTFLRSFILAATHSVPRTMRVDSQGNIIMAGLQENFNKPFTGTWIQKYDHKGKLLKSFYDIEPFAIKNNLSYHSKCTFDIDNQGNIYAVQSAMNKITIFNTEGLFINSFEVYSKYFINPQKYPEPKKWVKLSTNVKQKYHDSWTPLNEIIVTPNGFILLSIQLNELHDDINKDYVINIYDEKGNLKAGDLATNFRLLWADHDNFVYFLTYHDEDINKNEPEYKIGKFKINPEILK
jgi:hypothetical protein